MQAFNPSDVLSHDPTTGVAAVAASPPGPQASDGPSSKIQSQIGYILLAMILATIICCLVLGLSISYYQNKRQLARQRQQDAARPIDRPDEDNRSDVGWTTGANVPTGGEGRGDNWIEMGDLRGQSQRQA